MSGHLLDTSVVIATLDDRRALPDSAALSVITFGELRAGVRIARDDAVRAHRQARLRAVRAAFVGLPVDAEVADAYGDVLAVAREQRRTAKATDLLIIATAATHGRRLFTLDAAQAALAEAAGVAVTLAA